MPNTLVRLWYPVEGGHEYAVKTTEGLLMEHELAKITSEFLDKEVIGVKDILVIDSKYKEAVNLVIKK